MATLAQGLSALNVRARVVIEIVQICEPDGYLQAVQLVFSDGLSLMLTVWTDWRLVAELRSQAEMPGYLWPAEAMMRSVIEQMTGPVSEVVPGHNHVGELVEVRFTVGNRRLLVGSFAGDLTVELSHADDGGRRQVIVTRGDHPNYRSSDGNRP